MALCSLAGNRPCGRSSEWSRLGVLPTDDLIFPVSAVTPPWRRSQPAIHLPQTHFKAIHYLTSSEPQHVCKHHVNLIIWSNLKLIQTKSFSKDSSRRHPRDFITFACDRGRSRGRPGFLPMAPVRSNQRWHAAGEDTRASGVSQGFTRSLRC